MRVQQLGSRSAGRALRPATRSGCGLAVSRPAVESLTRRSAVAPPAGKAPAPNAMHDKRPGVFAATCSEQRDTLWVRLAPNEEYVGRDAYTGRAIGVFAQRPVAHDVDDSPRRSWIPAWLNLIRPWRDWDAPWYGKSVGLRYGDRAHKTGTVFM
jgi:hypothetical protein